MLGESWPPTAENGTEVLHNKVELDQFKGSPFFPEYQKHIKELKRDIQYKNGLPIDPWGRAYRYANQHTRMRLYSLGVDGVVSEDDVVQIIK